MSRPRKSDDLHRLHGSKSQATKPPRVTFAVANTRVPKELKGDADAVREWKRVSALLLDSNQLQETDRAALISYCFAWSRVIQAEREIRVTGIMITEDVFNRQGEKSGTRTVVNPLVKIARMERESLSRMSAKLGLSIRDRQSIPQAAPKPKKKITPEQAMSRLTPEQIRTAISRANKAREEAYSSE